MIAMCVRELPWVERGFTSNLIFGKRSSLGTLIVVLTSVTDDADRVHIKCHKRKRSIKFNYSDNY